MSLIVVFFFQFCSTPKCQIDCAPAYTYSEICEVMCDYAHILVMHDLFSTRLSADIKFTLVVRLVLFMLTFILTTHACLHSLYHTFSVINAMACTSFYAVVSLSFFTATYMES